MHLPTKPYNCDLCGKGFSAKPNLKSHLSAHLRRMNAKSYGNIELSPPRRLKIAQITGSFRRNSIPDDSENSSFTIHNSSDESSNQQATTKPPTTAKQELIEIAESPVDFISSSSSSSRNGEEISDDSEWNFYFKSLMQDLNRMDEKQKRKFKTKTYALIDEIFD